MTAAKAPGASPAARDAASEPAEPAGTNSARTNRGSSSWQYRLQQGMRKTAQLSTTRERFGNAVTHLEAVSPLATLARGYSVTTATDGKVLKQTKQVNTGDVLTTRLSDGWVESEVKSIKPVKKTRQP